MFRFEATRFIGRLKHVSRPLRDIAFEVQCRTAFEHAWSVATHGPAYKGESIDWKLERLAAQMKAMVEQLDSLACAYSESAAPIVAHPNARTDCELLVLETCQALIADGTIPQECAPAKLGYFSKNVVALADAADWGKWRPLKERVTAILDAASTEARSKGSKNFPRSISLFQFVLGVAVQNGVVRPRMRKGGYYLPISAALESLYPKTRDIQPRSNLLNSDEIAEGPNGE